MSTAKLNVWVTGVGDPCRIDNQHQWFVHVLHCDGSLLEWCGRVYQNIPTKCGHVEIEVPPGQYTVVATWSPGAPKDPHQLGNHLTHLQIVRVDCGDHACVTLFPPTVHFCGFWTIVALNTLMQLGDVDRRLGGDAVAAMTKVLDSLEPDPFTEATRRLAPAPEKPRRPGGKTAR